MTKTVFFILITVVSLLATSANGAPMAYSVNSDGQNPATGDSLYLIDLAVNGSEQLLGPLSAGSDDIVFWDTEGLAFSPDGTLWGVDDNARILFPINTTTGGINFLNIIPLPLSIPTGGSNDFGMTFACDNTLYLTSVITRTLYHFDELGTSTAVGGTGALGADISAIAAIGNPAMLYGLSLGNIDSPVLYSIDTQTGIATEIGPLVNAQPYNEAGLAFDADGNLWAITDRSGLGNQASQVLSIDVDTGLATVASTTIETGFESLAITPPTHCDGKIDAGDDDDAGDDESYPPIPTLGPFGLLTIILMLMFTGVVILRKPLS